MRSRRLVAISILAPVAVLALALILHAMGAVGHVRTSLHRAATAGDAQAARSLVEGGADVNARDEHGVAPLHEACYAGSAEIVELLLSHGTMVDARSDDGRTPLHMAAGSYWDNHNKLSVTRVVQVLLKYHAAVDAVDDCGRTPLDTAAANGRGDVARLLLEAGGSACTIHGVVGAGSTADLASRIENERTLVDEREEDEQYTPLHTAAALGDVAKAGLLLRYGARIEARDRLGRTPLHAAVLHGRQEMVGFLISKGAGPNTCDDDGDMPIHVAAECGNTPAIELLMKHGASMESRGLNGMTPLHKAANFADVSMVEWLIAHGAKVNAPDDDGRTAVHYAAANNVGDRVGVAKALLVHGADCDVRASFCETPLFDAVRNSNAALVRFLLDHGANPNAKDASGRTPSYYAKNAAIVRMLAEKH